MSKLHDLLSRADPESSTRLRALVDIAGRTRAGSASRDEDGADRLPGANETDHLAEAETGDRGACPTYLRTLPLRPPATIPVLPCETGNSPVTDQYRILRTKLMQHEKQPKLIAVSSPGIGDGKSVTAVNLAAAISFKSDSKVLLIDGDLRRSSVHGHLGLPAGPGLAEVLRGDCSEHEAVVKAKEPENLYVLCAGALRSRPAELLAGAQWSNLCSRLRNSFQYLVLDAPPVEAVPEYALLQKAADGVVLVIRADRTKRELMRHAFDAIPSAKLLGVLLNCVPAASLHRYAPAEYYPARSDG